MITDTKSMDRAVDIRPRRWWPVAMVVAVALGVAVVLSRPAVSRWAEADQSIDRRQLRFADVARGELLHEIAVQGRVVAAHRPTLFSRSAGIASLRVREGETVRTGQILAVVESPELESRLRQEQASHDGLRSEVDRRELLARRSDLQKRQSVDLLQVRVQAARREVDRNERMRELGIANLIDLEEAQDELELATLELAHARDTIGLEREMLELEVRDVRLQVERQRLIAEDLQRQVEALEIRAPFDGLVATLEVDDRDAVVAGQPLLGVVDLDALEVEVSIPEVYADDVSPGIEATMTVEGAQHTGTLTRIAPEVRAGVVMGRVRLTSGATDGLRQNQRLSTRLLLARRPDVLKLPRGPFLESGGGRTMYVVDGGIARRRAVALGIVSVTEIEVTAGLTRGETVVISDLTRFGDAESILLRD